MPSCGYSGNPIFILCRHQSESVKHGATRLLDRIRPFVEIIGGHPALGIGDAPSQCVIVEAGDDRAAGLDLDEPVAIVPDVGAAAVADQFSLAVVAQHDVIGLGQAAVVIEGVIVLAAGATAGHGSRPAH